MPECIRLEDGVARIGDFCWVTRALLQRSNAVQKSGWRLHGLTACSSSIWVKPVSLHENSSILFDGESKQFLTAKLTTC
jgi:hypothetical protein